MNPVLHTLKGIKLGAVTRGLILCALVLIPFAFAQMATDDFRVQQLVGGDAIPPTTPTNVTATPVATTQIDLAWDASTDNYLMGGYQIWRDDAFLATTTGTTYADVGLTASTTYTYYLYAFDSFFNYSASTTQVATTTLSVPPPSPTSTPTTTPLAGTTGSLARPFSEQITFLEVIPEHDSVIIRFATAGHVRPVIRWGRTSSYELGSIASRAFATSHETKITGLIPGVRYQFTIEGENRIEKYGTLYAGTFVTLPPEDVFPPGNVRELTAVGDGDDVLLSWVNPSDLDFTKVRVLRSDRFYPADTQDGWVVYEGDGEALRDTGILEEGKTQYYTIFAYDALGNISSGAVVAVSPEGVEPPVRVPGENQVALRFDEVRFVQDGMVLPARDGSVTIDGAKQLSVSIPYERLPEHLKTILVTVSEDEGSSRSFTFLLRVDRDGDFYTATLAPFGKSGTFPVTVSVLDYTTAEIGYTEGLLRSSIKTLHTQPKGFIGYLGGFGSEYGYSILFSLLLILLMVFGHRVLVRRV